MTGQLSPLSDLNEKLQVLLELAVSTVSTALVHQGDYLLLLMGSGAYGETCGVMVENRLLPLSDLDLLIIMPERYDPSLHKRLQQELDRVLAGVVEQERLTHNPIELGMGTVANLKSIPLTLEMLEAVIKPQVLCGDAAMLAPLMPVALRGPTPFEALRLLMNRVAETLVPREMTDITLAGMRMNQTIAPATESPVPIPMPMVTDWHETYRQGKLLLDMGKALLAARGELEPSLAKRNGRLATLITDLRPGSEPLIETLTSWTHWRLAPSWPPPPLSMAVIAEMADLLITTLGDRLPLPAIGASDRAAIAGWRRVLALETGPFKERLRRWVYMARKRPVSVSSPQMTVLALRWLGAAWPGSMASLMILLFWMTRIGMGTNRESLGRRGDCVKSLVKEIPARRADGEPLEKKLAEYLLWARRAGTC